MTLHPQRAVFLDRDGVVNRCFVREGVTRPPRDLTELEVLPGVESAAADLSAAGYLLIVVTNQPDVARGAQSAEQVEEIHAVLRRQLPLTDILTCFHDDQHHCECRKPKPGMLHTAQARWNLDLPHSYLVGDRWSDVVAGQAAGCRAVLVETPFSRAARCRPDHAACDLRSAADWILQPREEKP